MIGAMRTLLLTLIMACTACTSDAEPPPERQASSTAEPASMPGAAAGSTLDQIRAMIGSAACSDASQCRTLPIGARPCGGPEGYLAYSTSTTPEAELHALAERYKQERTDAHAKSGAMSDCRFMPDPGAVCVAGTCQLAPAGSSAI